MNSKTMQQWRSQCFNCRLNIVTATKPRLKIHVKHFVTQGKMTNTFCRQRLITAPTRTSALDYNQYSVLTSTRLRILVQCHSKLLTGDPFRQVSFHLWLALLRFSDERLQQLDGVCNSRQRRISLSVILDVQYM